jgi:archaeosortase B (VPXXXP-CTERM-specific)
MLVYSRFTESGPFESFRNLTAKATGLLLNIFNSGVDVEENIVSSSGFTMGIIEACTGIVPMLLFILAVLAYPSSVKQKVTGIAIGIVIIFAVNIIRTSTLFAVGTHFPDYFENAHYLIWQSLMIVVSILLWLLWASRINHAV